MLNAVACFNGPGRHSKARSRDRGLLRGKGLTGFPGVARFTPVKDTSKTVLAFLAMNGPAYAGAIAQATGLTENTVLGCVTALRRVGYTIKGANGWELTVKGMGVELDLPPEPSLADRLAALEAQSDALAVDNAALARRVQNLEETVSRLWTERENYVRRPAT